MHKVTNRFHISYATCTLCLIFLFCHEVIVAESSDSDNRNTYCDVFNKVENGEVTRRNALIGANVSISVVEDYGTYRGTDELNENFVALLIFDEIAHRAQFNYKETYGIIQPPKGTNETWTDVLDSTLDSYDVAVDWFTHSLERVEKGIIFVENWYDTSLIMIQQKKDYSNSKSNTRFANWFGFLAPFTWQVWLVLTLIVILSGLVYHILELMSYGWDKRKVENCVKDDIYYSLLASTGQNNLDPKTSPSRIMLISFLFLFIIILAEYTSNLTSFLVNQNRVEIINEFSDAIKHNYRICVWRGSPDVIRIKHDYPTGRYVLKDTEIELYTGIIEDECDIALGYKDSFKSYIHKEEYNPNCNLETIGSEVSMDMSLFAIKDSKGLCSSLLREIVDIYLLEMIKDGTLKSIKEIDQKTTTNNCNINKQNDEDAYSLTLADIGGVFLFHFMWTIIAIILAIIKWVFHKMRSVNVQGNDNTQPQNRNTEPTIMMLDLVKSLKDELKEVKKEIVKIRKNSTTPSNTTASDIEQQQTFYHCQPMNFQLDNNTKGYF